MKVKMRFISVVLVILLSCSVQALAAGIQYTVVSGDTLWKISQNYKVPIDAIKSYNSLASDNLYIGQKLLIPQVSNDTVQSSGSIAYKVVYGDTLWIISQKFGTTISTIKYLNNLKSDLLVIGQNLTVASPSNISAYNPAATETHLVYISYIVKKGDTLWSVGQQFKILYQEVAAANKISQSSYLTPGQAIKLPVHIVPLKQTPGPQYGELLDWWSEAQYVFYTDSTAKVTDFNTGKFFYIKRTTGANHADCETLTSNDTNIMKQLWGGSWNWADRPVIIEVGGRKLAASMAGMPHAGLDSYPADINIDNRSGNYGTGLNLDYIKGNNMDGHFDVHFLNSTRHMDGTIDQRHQATLHIAAGK